MPSPGELRREGMIRNPVSPDVERCPRFARPGKEREHKPAAHNNASQPTYSARLTSRGSLDHKYDPFNSVLPDTPIDPYLKNCHLERSEATAERSRKIPRGLLPPAAVANFSPRNPLPSLRACMSGRVAPSWRALCARVGFHKGGRHWNSIQVPSGVVEQFAFSW